MLYDTSKYLGLPLMEILHTSNSPEWTVLHEALFHSQEFLGILFSWEVLRPVVD